MLPLLCKGGKEQRCLPGIRVLRQFDIKPLIDLIIKEIGKVFLRFICCVSNGKNLHNSTNVSRSCPRSYPAGSAK